MKVKKLLAGVLSCMMFACVFTACGDKDDDGNGKKSGKNGYVDCAEEFFEASLSKKGGEKYYTYLLPDDVIKELENKDVWEDMIDVFNDDMEDMLEYYKKIEVKEVNEDKELNSLQLKGAEVALLKQSKRFAGSNMVPDDRYDVEEGYAMKVKIKFTDNDGDSDTVKRDFCIVKVNGEKNWKVLMNDADELSKLGESYDDYMEEYFG